MRWYLPDGNPLLWDELRRLLRGVLLYRLLLLDVVVMGGILLVNLYTAPKAMDIVAWASFGRNLWRILILAQAVFITLLGPALTAGAISAAREQHTLDALLLTPLPSTSLIHGKFYGAMAIILLLLLCSLPVISVMVMLGGLSPLQIILSQFALFVSAAPYTSLGLLASSRSRRTAYALPLSYLYILPTLPFVYSLTLVTSLFFAFGLLVYACVLAPCITMWALANSTDLVQAMRHPGGKPPPPRFYYPPGYLPPASSFGPATPDSNHNTMQE